ncbi:acid phosphatase [Amantichitinum ursilacus]|uniref:Serotype-specific antigen 1 n=1 Tax=Amantichitinum ursilacus TaxID=857265 RepID=A0A0N0XMV4_9NEIS|nr:phosphatase PAP2 family protein [Amantichitinum ursilacus]KPC55394.1 Serotype-specific antigen 1 precursor [Amantichitinum ursilacus]
MQKTSFTLAVMPLALALALAGCGGDSDSDASTSTPVVTNPTLTIPAAPTGTGAEDIASVQDVSTVLPFVDYAYTNQRGDARYATIDTNAGVRVLARYLDLWTPSSLIVDAGVTAAAYGTFPAVVASSWTGIPGDSTDGKAVNSAVLAQNIQYVVTATTGRTADQATAAYLDDRRGKGYSVTDGMGPLTTAWRTAAQQTTSITSVAADATSVVYNDSGNNVGVGAASNTRFGNVVDLLGTTVGTNASTEPAKRFFKYARPFRWSSSVVVVPALVPAESSTPNTDGGFPSGHSAEAGRDAFTMAWLVPERFQEMVSRGLELGENRILAGMHSPLDVIGGRIQALATVAANLRANTGVADVAYAQAHSTLMAAAGVSTEADFISYAHSASSSTDRFADYATNKANNARRLTYGFSQIGDATKPATVPKGAEILIQTRFPYLTYSQRRVVLKTTALTSGYPVMDDAEGWGRIDLFKAGDGFGAFNGDVAVTMDATLGGYNAADTWRNDIAGAGKLTLKGTGTLHLAGANSYTGGTDIEGGTLQADSVSGFGNGDVYVGKGTAVIAAASALSVANYTQLATGASQLVMGSGTQGQIKASGNVTLAGGTLNITFASGYTPSVGSTLTLINAKALNGTFSSITVNGFKATPTYSATGLTLHLDSAA